MTRTRWLLFLDESGSLEPEDTHVVAGLLVRAEDTPGFHDPLRGALEGIYPLWPWPPHAAHLLSPVSRLAAAVARPFARSEGDESVWMRALCEPLLEALRGSTDRRAAAFLEAAGSTEPTRMSPSLLWATHALLRQLEGRHLQRLEEACRAQDDGLADVLSGLAEHEDLEATVFVATSPANPGSPAAPTPKATRRLGVARDRYVRTLETLLERVWLLLQAQEEQQLQLFVATRDVELASVTARNRRGVALYPRYVGDIIAQATEGLPVAERPPKMLPVGSPNRYGCRSRLET